MPTEGEEWEEGGESNAIGGGDFALYRHVEHKRG